MFKELFDRLDKKRNVEIESTEYGVYSEKNMKALYNDNTMQYEFLTKRTRHITVSSVDSFIDFISEELKRLNNASGQKTTVTIHDDGGFFSADDDFGTITCSYGRSLTQSWKTLNEVANKKLNHEQLLITLQKLRPYINDFEKLYEKMIDIRTIGRSEMVSNPVYIHGENGTQANSGYKITFKLQSGEQDATNLPDRFSLTLPFAKGRLEQTYEIPIELMYLNNGDGRIEILFQCPELEEIEEMAIRDEADYLKEKLSQFNDLLLLINY